METESNYPRGQNEPRSRMKRSGRHPLIIGISGIIAGIYALAGTYIAYRFDYFENENFAYNTLRKQRITEDTLNLVWLAAGIFFLTISSAILITLHKAKNTSVRILTFSTRRILINLVVPLLTGGFLILILFIKGLLGFIAPVSLIFYGLALVNMSNFSYNELRYLGIAEIILGLIAAYYVGFSLIFWSIGFGLMHIIYGIIIHMRYERSKNS